MKIIPHLLLLLALSLNAQKKDTLTINASDLILKNLNFGNSTYLVYNTKGQDQPMQNATLVKIATQKKSSNNQDYILVNQTWEADTIIHQATTRFDSKQLKTLSHSSWWKRKGYTEHYDFAKAETRFDGPIKEEIKSGLTTSFNAALTSDFLNWHSDLVLFPLLPFKENRVFKINFYEPGHAIPKQETYEVIGSEKITLAGNPIDCWILNYKVEKPTGYQRFWISKQSREVLKEEDNFGAFYRYKLKLIAHQN